MKIKNGLRIAILGATGLVGRALLRLLEGEQALTIESLNLLGSEQSFGKYLGFKGHSIPIESPGSFDWNGVNLAFFVASPEICGNYRLAALASGCIVIDSSGQVAVEQEFMEPASGLWLPTIGPLPHEMRHHQCLALPHPLVSQLMTVWAPLAQEALGLIPMRVMGLLPASLSGSDAVKRLAGASAQLLSGQSLELGSNSDLYPFTVRPILDHVGSSTALERRIHQEVRQLFSKLSFDCSPLSLAICLVKTPCFYGQTVGLSIACDLADLRACIDRIDWAPPIHWISPQAFSARDPYTTQEDAPPQLTVTEPISLLGDIPACQCWTYADNVSFCGAWMAVQLAKQRFLVVE